MQNDETGITIPRSVFWGLLVPLVVGYGGGAWYMSSLNSSVSTQAANQSSYATSQASIQANLDQRIHALETRVDINKDQFQGVSNAIDQRLTRMEAQLGYLVKTSTPDTGSRR